MFFFQFIKFAVCKREQFFISIKKQKYQPSYQSSVNILFHQLQSKGRGINLEKRMYDEYKTLL